MNMMEEVASAGGCASGPTEADVPGDAVNGLSPREQTLQLVYSSDEMLADVINLPTCHHMDDTGNVVTNSCISRMVVGPGDVGSSGVIANTLTGNPIGGAMPRHFVDFTDESQGISDIQSGQQAPDRVDPSIVVTSPAELASEDGGSITDSLFQSGSIFLLQTEDQSHLGPSTANPVLILTRKADSAMFEANVMMDQLSYTKILETEVDSNNIPSIGLTSQAQPTESACSVPETARSVKSSLSSEASFVVASAHKPTRGGQACICTVDGCGRQFSSLGYLKYHQLVHDGQRALSCPYDGCNRRFAWPAHLKYHQLTHVGNKQYECPIQGCDKAFITSQQLSVHVRTHTGERPYICVENGCSKAFTTLGNLRNHHRVHTGERPYLCDVGKCARKFAEYSSLRKHKLTHTGEKPFSCPLCRQQFSQSGSRNVHIKKHHPSSLLALNRPTEQEQADVVAATEPLSYQVETVSTEVAGADSDDLNLAADILGSADSLHAVLSGSNELRTVTSGANVVVLSQPQEMVAMATGYHDTGQNNKEEVVYGGDLLAIDLQQEDPSA